MFTKLFYRHWDSYVEDKRQHLFVVSADGGDPKDVTPGDRDSYPTSTTFATGGEFHLQPGQQVPDLHGRPRHRRGVEYELLDLPRAGDGRHQGLGVPDE